MQGVERAPQLAPLLKDLSNRCHSQTKTIERGQDSGGETEMFFEGEKKCFWPENNRFKFWNKINKNKRGNRLA